MKKRNYPINYGPRCDWTRDCHENSTANIVLIVALSLLCMVVLVLPTVALHQVRGTNAMLMHQVQMIDDRFGL